MVRAANPVIEIEVTEAIQITDTVVASRCIATLTSVNGTQVVKRYTPLPITN